MLQEVQRKTVCKTEAQVTQLIDLVIKLSKVLYRKIGAFYAFKGVDILSV